MNLTAADVIEQLEGLANPKRAALMLGFYRTGPGEYGEGDVFLGLTVPQQRTVAKASRELALGGIARLLQDARHECRLTGLLILVDRFAKKKEERPEIAAFYLEHLAAVNNWDLVDASAPHILGAWLLSRPGEERGVLHQLARSGLLWRQRVAMVACLALIRAGQFSETVAVADLLRSHSHDLIHKAVGWMLREMGKRDEAALAAYLAPRYRTLPRTCLRYAIEKFPQETRKAYLKGEI